MSTGSGFGSTQSSLSRSASVGSHSHQPAASSYQSSGSFYSPASVPVPQPSTPPLQAGTSYFGVSFSSPFGSTVTPNAIGGESIFAGPESSFSRPHESSPLQNRDTLLRSNSFNSPGNPFRRNASSGSSNTGGLFRDSSSPNSGTLHRANSTSGNKHAPRSMLSPNNFPVAQPTSGPPFVNQGSLFGGDSNASSGFQFGQNRSDNPAVARPAESNMRPNEVSWRNLCTSASLDVGLLTASFNRAYAALDKSKFMHFRQELHRAFVTAGASDLEGICALEAFCFWALEQYFLRVR